MMLHVFLFYHQMLKRIQYIYPILITICLGLASRKLFAPQSWGFLYFGDILWATLFFFIFRFLFVHKTLYFNSLITIIWCYAVEFSQLYQSPWINNIRATTIGALLLGSGFLWSDLVCYVFGAGLGILIEALRFQKTTPQ